ncbi:MAG: AraC family transcriptional regulator, partial [Desulforhopalus sp.]
MNPETEKVAQSNVKLSDAMAALAEKIDRWTLARGNEPATAYTPLSIYRHEAPTELISYLQEPSLCLIVQGKKRVLLGEESYYYDKDHYLITAVDLPLIAQIFEAGKSSPYLGLTLRLEKKQIAQMLLDDHVDISRNQASDRGLVVSKIELPIVQAILRLIDLLDHPSDIPVLAPLIQREILYRLLVSEQGQRLKQISMVGSHSHQIARAIEWLKENY